MKLNIRKSDGYVCCILMIMSVLYMPPRRASGINGKINIIINVGGGKKITTNKIIIHVLCILSRPL